MGWETSNRRLRLPSDWKQRTKLVLARDPICMVCKTKPSTEVDHIKAGDNHSSRNLQGVCSDCHKVKSAREGSQAQGFYGRKRPVEDHPGIQAP